MDEIDLATPRSSYVHYKVEHSEGDKMPKYKIVTMPNAAEFRYDVLMKRNRYLITAVVILLLALSALTVFVVFDKVFRDAERADLAEDKQSLDKLSALLAQFNSTIARIDAKVNSTEDFVQDLIGESMEASKAELRQDVTNELKVLVDDVHSIVNETLDKSTGEIKVANLRLEQRLNQSISEMYNIVDETQSLINVTVDREVQASLETSLNKSMSAAVADLREEIFRLIFEGPTPAG